MTYEEALQRQQAMGLGEDRSSAEAVASGRMTPEEYEHRQQRRAAPNAGSDGRSITEAAKGWDGRTNANSAVTDEAGNKMDTSGALTPFQGDPAGSVPLSQWTNTLGRRVGGGIPVPAPGSGGSINLPSPWIQTGQPAPYRPTFSPREEGGTNFIDQVLGQLLGGRRGY